MALTVSPLIRIGVRTSACWRSSCTLLRSCGVTFELKPQEGHHFDIEVPLISISQLQIELVQVCIEDHGFDLIDQALGLFHRDHRASDVPPEPPAFQFDTGGTKAFGITGAVKLLVLPPLATEAATVLAALPWCLFFHADNFLTQSYDM